MVQQNRMSRTWRERRPNKVNPKWAHVQKKRAQAASDDIVSRRPFCPRCPADDHMLGRFVELERWLVGRRCEGRCAEVRRSDSKAFGARRADWLRDLFDVPLFSVCYVEVQAIFSAVPSVQYAGVEDISASDARSTIFHKQRARIGPSNQLLLGRIPHSPSSAAASAQRSAQLRFSRRDIPTF